MIKGCCCGFFCSLLFQKRDHPRRELNSIHCQGLIVYIQQLHSGFPAVLLLLLMGGGGECGVSTTKKQDGTKEGQTNSKCINNGGSEKLICKFASKSNLRWSSHPRM